ncbi:MAG TPA: hypothetical protein VFN10_18120 [Thermoanaerobaculia bacterium]|nr:hypothetical protein [Thermoanaerobaculia bacterium]
MKKLVCLAVLLQIYVLSASAAEPAPGCTLCAGAVSDLATAPAATIPLLVRISQSDLATAATALSNLTPEQRRATTVIVRYSTGEGDRLINVEQTTKSIVEWARLHGPFAALGVTVDDADSALAAYAIKRLSVTAQGLDVAKQIVVDRGALDALFTNGAQPYFDAVIVDAADVQPTLAWLAERDPSKKIFAVVTPQAPNAMFDVAQALANGATRAFAATTAADAQTSFAQFNRAFSGDWAYDSTSRIAMLDAKGNAIEMPVLTFVRGEDLRTMLIPRGDANAATIVALPVNQFTTPRRIDAAGERAITDTGKRGERLLVGMQPAKQPFAIVADRAEKIDANVTKESIDVATRRGITVEEIIRNHQSYKAYQESIEPYYIARNETKLRFDIGGGAEAIEATIAGDFFSDPSGTADWVWQDFYINGVRWKYGRIPELPLLQPEKVSQLPLDIHLTNDYRYELVRETELAGYHVYEVRFEPPRNASADLPLYRGTVYIDARTWARVRISMIQLNLTGEILSNEERVDFAPFARATKQPLTAAQVATTDAREILWLPYDVSAQQVVSAAGRANVVQRATNFTNFRIDPTDYTAQLAQASASDARMVRDTPAGLRYLEKSSDGGRVVKEGFDTSRLFALGGIHHDAGLDYPVVPLGGIDYFNFNLGGRGIQTNVFFAGVILAANATHPNVGNTRTNVGLDFFGIAIPTENALYRNGEEQPQESVKSVPLGLYLRAGHPFAQFGKVDVSFGVSHYTYQRGEDTAATYVVPSDTFVLNPGISAQYSRHGYTIAASYDYNRRTSWEPWGNLAEFDPAQKSFTRFGASLGKTFFLPKFQRIGLDVNYIDGQRLDRFSKYELGFFGAHRVHGVRSGSVQAERGVIGHISYGFVFSEQFRLEAFYDHALLDDTTAGFRREPFQGLGIAGQTIGPYGTLLRLDVGKTIGRNAQDGFVANVVFLKLF